MKTQLLPYYFKKVGLAIYAIAFLPSLVAGIIDGYKIQIHQSISKETLHTLDIIGIAGLVLYALSKDKVYDELLQRLRLEAIKMTFIMAMGIITIIYLLFPNYRIHPSYLVNLQVLCFISIYYFKKENMVASVGQRAQHE